MQEAVKILSFFVPRGTEVVSLRGRNPEENAVFTTQQEPLDTEIPLVVLVNNGFGRLPPKSWPVRCRTWTGRCSSAAEPSVRGSCSLPGRSVTMLI